MSQLQYQQLAEPLVVSETPVTHFQVLCDMPARLADRSEQGWFSLVEVQAPVVVPDLVQIVGESPRRPDVVHDAGWFSLVEFDVPAAPTVDFVQVLGESPLPPPFPLEAMLAGGIMPPIEVQFPTTLDDVLDVLRALAVDLQPNAQNPWEVRRNFQKIVEGLSQL